MRVCSGNFGLRSGCHNSTSKMCCIAASTKAYVPLILKSRMEAKLYAKQHFLEPKWNSHP